MHECSLETQLHKGLHVLAEGLIPFWTLSAFACVVFSPLGTLLISSL